MLDVPTRLTDWHCALEARDTARNVARGYRFFATDDLFSHWIGELTWGGSVVGPVAIELSYSMRLTGFGVSRHSSAGCGVA
jgi:hypothetical protein